MGPTDPVIAGFYEISFTKTKPIPISSDSKYKIKIKQIVDGFYIFFFFESLFKGVWDSNNKRMKDCDNKCSEDS